MDKGLVFVGKVIEIELIPDATFIVSATVICGSGGKWKGVVQREHLGIGDMCIVYMPDSIIPESDSMRFMEKNRWRVKMCRFKGAPSEVLIMPIKFDMPVDFSIGDDLTEWFGVTKYYKPVPTNLQGKMEGEFPGFIPKTDEPNYQRSEDLIEKLCGRSFYVTQKYDGSSTTAYKYKGKFGVCSRNWEMKRDENNGYWKVAIDHELEEKLPDGIALQWETCGPKIQNNPMGLKEIRGYAFSAYDIIKKEYLPFWELALICRVIQFPLVNIILSGELFHRCFLTTECYGTYPNGHAIEGIVIRSTKNMDNGKPISFKMINLDYEGDENGRRKKLDTRSNQASGGLAQGIGGAGGQEDSAEEAEDGRG